MPQRTTVRPKRTRGRSPERESLSRAAEDLLAKARSVTAQTQQLREQAAVLTAVERSLRDAHGLFSELYDFVPVPYLLLSPTGVIVRANEAALEMFGVERPWIVGRPLVAYLESASVRKVLGQILDCRPGYSTFAEATLRTAEGWRPAHLTVRREALRSGHAANYHLAIVDLSEVRRLQEERRQADAERRRSVDAERIARAASEAKDEFLAMLSHELRTPLTPILAAADTLVAHSSMPAEMRLAIDIIRRNIRAEAHLIDDLLDVARINRKTFAVDRRPVDVHRLLSDLEQGWAAPLAERNLALRMTCDAGEHWVQGDPARLSQVLRNLVSNAAKFTDTGGTIAVTSESRPGAIRLVVADTGIGIAGAALEKLFSPFVRTPEGATRGGLGLGLVISKGIVEAHGGSLSVASAGPGQGTSAIVELATIPNVEETDALQERARDPRADCRRVLLVEDDKDSAQMLAFLLSSEGYSVQIAHTARQARELADLCDVIVSDIGLPDGSGLELMRALMAERPRRAIALSGYGSSEDIERSILAGFSEHLTKPVDLDRLVQSVRRLADG